MAIKMQIKRDLNQLMPFYTNNVKKITPILKNDDIYQFERSLDRNSNKDEFIVHALSGIFNFGAINIFKLIINTVPLEEDIFYYILIYCCCSEFPNQLDFLQTIYETKYETTKGKFEYYLDLFWQSRNKKLNKTELKLVFWKDVVCGRIECTIVQHCKYAFYFYPDFDENMVNELLEYESALELFNLFNINLIPIGEIIRKDRIDLYHYILERLLTIPSSFNSWFVINLSIQYAIMINATRIKEYLRHAKINFYLIYIHNIYIEWINFNTDGKYKNIRDTLFFEYKEYTDKEGKIISCKECIISYLTNLTN